MKPAFLAALLVAALTAVAPARTIRVPGEYPTLQLAIASALPGDVVLLAPGRHVDAYMTLGDGITIRGDLERPEQVVIDAAEIGYAFRAESAANVRLEGLTIESGHANGSSSYAASGGGIFISRSSVTLERVIFRDNRAESSGGGVRAAYSNVEIIDCEFLGCVATKGGGAIDLSYDSDALVYSTSFEGNRAAWGGAISARTGSSCLFEDCDFLENSTLPPQDLGGAFFSDHAARVTFRNCVMADNSSRQGGAARLTGAMVGLTNCTIDGNSASEAGAGFMVRGGSLVLANCIVSNNDGSAVDLTDDPNLWVSASDIYGNLGGDWTGPLADLQFENNNLSADPMYCGDGIYTLQEESPCAEENSGVGQIGARPVGCVDTSLILDDLTATYQFGGVLVTWEVSGLVGHEFRLTGRARNDAGIPAWNVAFEEDGAEGHYRAADRPERTSYPVVYKLDVRSEDGAPWIALGEVEVNAPIGFGGVMTVESVFPNPFNPQVTISFTLAAESAVQAAIYDLQGRKIRVLSDGVMPAGHQELHWDSRDEAGRTKATGTYILRIATDSGPIFTRKLLLIK